MSETARLEVWLIEGEDRARSLCLEALRPLTRVTAFDSGRSAARQAGAPQVLVARLKPEDEFGVLDLLQELRQREAGLPAVVVVDPEVSADLLARAHLLDCRVVHKPFTTTELRMGLLEALARSGESRSAAPGGGGALGAPSRGALQMS